MENKDLYHRKYADKVTETAARQSGQLMTVILSREFDIEYKNQIVAEIPDVYDELPNYDDDEIPMLAEIDALSNEMPDYYPEDKIRESITGDESQGRQDNKEFRELEEIALIGHLLIKEGTRRPIINPDIRLWLLKQADLPTSPVEAVPEQADDPRLGDDVSMRNELGSNIHLNKLSDAMRWYVGRAIETYDLPYTRPDIQGTPLSDLEGSIEIQEDIFKKHTDEYDRLQFVVSSLSVQNENGNIVIRGKAKYKPQNGESGDTTQDDEYEVTENHEIIRIRRMDKDTRECVEEFLPIAIQSETAGFQPTAKRKISLADRLKNIRIPDRDHDPLRDTKESKKPLSDLEGSIETGEPIFRKHTDGYHSLQFVDSSLSVQNENGNIVIRGKAKYKPQNGESGNTTQDDEYEVTENHDIIRIKGMSKNTRKRVEEFLRTAIQSEVELRPAGPETSLADQLKNIRIPDQDLDPLRHIRHNIRTNMNTYDSGFSDFGLRAFLFGHIALFCKQDSLSDPAISFETFKKLGNEDTIGHHIKGTFEAERIDLIDAEAPPDWIENPEEDLKNHLHQTLLMFARLATWDSDTEAGLGEGEYEYDSLADLDQYGRMKREDIIGSENFSQERNKFFLNNKVNRSVNLHRDHPSEQDSMDQSSKRDRIEFELDISG